MSTGDFDKAFKKFNQEMHRDEQTLSTDQQEFHRLQEEIRASEALIEEKKKLILTDKHKAGDLDREIRKLKDEQVSRHVELEKLSRQNRERLAKSGADMKPKYF